jgi:hypothetical protein
MSEAISAPSAIIKVGGGKQLLFFSAFLPGDDDGNNDSSPGEAMAALRAMDDSLKQLLEMRFPRFLSYVMFDTELAHFLDSFLRYRRRHHDDKCGPAKGECSAAKSGR